MPNYELLIENINPCGGEKFAQKDFLEVDAESPEAYVAANGQFPVLNVGATPEGDTVITTGDGKGRIIRYTFTE